MGTSGDAGVPSRGALDRRCAPSRMTGAV